jgi:hypothetical protein
MAEKWVAEMLRAGALLAFTWLFLAASAAAHHAPSSYLRLDFRAGSVGARLMVPVSELGFAMQQTPSLQALPAYLLKHLGAVTPQGAAWTVQFTAVHASTYLDQEYFVADFTLLPPPGGSTRDFTLTSDAVTHEVRNHVVIVVAERDSENAALESTPVVLGALQYPARRLVIRPPVIAPR